MCGQSWLLKGSPRFERFVPYRTFAPFSPVVLGCDVPYAYYLLCTPVLLFLSAIFHLFPISLGAQSLQKTISKAN